MSEPENQPQPNDTTTPPTEAAPGAGVASDPNSSAPPPPTAEAGDALAAAKQEASAAQERYLRSLADLENFRRRATREKEELRAFAAARVVEEVLPVLDNLALALTAAKAPNADLPGLVGGIEMVATQLKNALGTHGLKEINPVGQPFDPNFHEALAQQASADVAEGSVLQVIRIGYTLNGRLLRPASVLVSSGAPAQS